MIFWAIVNLALVFAGPAPDPSYKDQTCTDPRTMKKHAAYSEWADAYSCTRHRCQPGGRNLAIYTVGCKHVEAPESAIECEEVVEDTNMQFPYCCTRLRCLVVIRGEVWTRVLGQPWETLPAAPWSHMYKMKKPPPGDFFPKNTSEGPVYELSSNSDPDEPRKVMRSQKNCKDCPEEGEASPRASIASPDIVIALSATSDQKDHEKYSKTGNNEKRSGRKRSKRPSGNPYLDGTPAHHQEIYKEEVYTEKVPVASEEKFYGNSNGVTHQETSKNHQGWTEIPSSQWTEHTLDGEPSPLKTEEKSYHPQPQYLQDMEKEEKPSNLQALVDAIGTRMRDIENVVQKMSEKVQQVKPLEPQLSAEKRAHHDMDSRIEESAGGLTRWIHSVISALSSAVESRHEGTDTVSPTHHKIGEPSDADVETYRDHKEAKDDKQYKAKRPSTGGDQYKRFSTRSHGTKYLHSTTDLVTEVPLFVEDKSMNGYFSDASNSVLRRGSPNTPKRTKRLPELYIYMYIKAKIPLSNHEITEPIKPTKLNNGRSSIYIWEEPPLIYMAPVDPRRKSHESPAESEESDKKHKKRVHKKKHARGKKHHNRDKRKRFNRLNSAEIDKNVVSLEDSSALITK